MQRQFHRLDIHFGNVYNCAVRVQPHTDDFVRTVPIVFAATHARLALSQHAGASSCGIHVNPKANNYELVQLSRIVVQSRGV